MWQLDQGSPKNLTRAHGNVKKKERMKWAENAPKNKMDRECPRNKMGWGSLRCCVKWSNKSIGQ